MHVGDASSIRSAGIPACYLHVGDAGGIRSAGILACYLRAGDAGSIRSADIPVCFLHVGDAGSIRSADIPVCYLRAASSGVTETTAAQRARRNKCVLPRVTGILACFLLVGGAGSIRSAGISACYL
jgi:hypothetical protein